MRTKDFVQTIFMLCSVITIFIFGVIYYLMLSDNNSEGIIKEALTLTANFFGGIATLAAAYVATILFNDWKEPYHQEKLDKCIEDIIDTTYKVINYFAMEYSQNIIKIQSKIMKKLQELDKVENQEEKIEILSEIDVLILELTQQPSLLSQNLYKLIPTFQRYTDKDHKVVAALSDVMMRLNVFIVNLATYKGQIINADNQKTINEFIESEQNKGLWMKISKYEYLTKFIEKSQEVQTQVKNTNSTKLVKSYLSNNIF
ncbi:hypothetical protein OSH17_12410 [Acinetobacter baumannii]|uniref:hypothetical protein n=1 Tax=Acinetobacter baumannii TaxID=470 RepID=UPI00144AA983|nr:hypothetical protein [Acinetobacter baumannii]NLP55343.1 hypothetical protein [Acinetobacter baumannii]NQE74051.1 hypothetical protein [Acinetobacter baumannii]QNT87625.1 hypothetical protein H0N27_12335 [Acinetobacter baumannii]WEX34726.1 hypothetical protein OSH13_05170 [Acinetobacter baumannii]WEX38099.1 hypothetical protein OSH14_05170 [Acinetobacter baumannii]